MSKENVQNELLNSLNNVIDALENSKETMSVLYEKPGVLDCSSKKVMYSLDTLKNILGSEELEKNRERLQQYIDDIKDIRSFLFSGLVSNDAYKNCCKELSEKNAMDELEEISVAKKVEDKAEMTKQENQQPQQFQQPNQHQYPNKSREERDNRVGGDNVREYDKNRHNENRHNENPEVSANLRNPATPNNKSKYEQYKAQHNKQTDNSSLQEVVV